MEINFTYLYQPPKRWTFQQPKLKKWTEGWCIGKTLNLFAGKTELDVDEVRVDIDEENPSHYCMDAEAFILMAIEQQWKFDTIVLDPPYNLRKSREKYQGKYIGSFTKIKNLLSKILNKKGRIITFGYDSVGMSKSRGFKKIAICLVCHSGDHNDTICITEEKE